MSGQSTVQWIVQKNFSRQLFQWKSIARNVRKQTSTLVRDQEQSSVLPQGLVTTLLDFLPAACMKVTRVPLPSIILDAFEL
jgi:hypothetical protein